MNAPAQHSTFLDPLTGAYTRGLLDLRLQEELARATREGTSLTVCLFDVDHFKSINDAYGHARGDQVLCELTRTVQGALRTSDVLFRYGGDEFVLLLPSTPSGHAGVVCERLFQEVRGHPFAGTPPLQVTLSMGVATFPEDGPEMLRVADERNYTAKREGRNRWVNTSEPTTEAVLFQNAGRALERDVQMATFQQFLVQLGSQHKGVFRILGEVGSGRSFFLDEVKKHARLQGHHLLTLRPSRALQHHPYGVFTDLLQGQDTPFSPEPFLQNLKDTVQKAGHTGLMVCVDDMALLDWASRTLLSRLLREPSGFPVGVVYTLSSQTPPPQLPVPHPLEVQVVLQGLSRAAVRVWLREALQWEVPEALLEWLHTHCKGLPASIRRRVLDLQSRKHLERTPEGWILDPLYCHPNPAETEPSPPRLPVPTTPFFGREKEARDVSALFEHRRLVTLLGPGGIGKTRLGIEVAELRQDQYPGGVWFVSLDRVRSPELVLSTLCQVLGLKESKRPLQEDLQAHLKDRRALLVLDNFEQVIEAAPLLEDLLKAAPGLHLLVTSRERLNLSGEQLFTVPPLSLPPGDFELQEGDLYQYGALSLLVDRVQAREPDLVLTPQNLKSIQRIGQLLEGHPLALELAAATLDVFSLQELQEQLGERRLSLLAEGPRNLSDRQRTLRNTIDWSHDLLTDPEKWVFHRMGAFVGGWTLAAALRVCQDRHLQVNVQGVLMKLQSKSLVQYDRQERRFCMLETIREYASEKLQQGEMGMQVREAHARYFLDLGQQAEAHLVGEGQQEWLGLLEHDHSNLREALGFMLEQGHIRWALQLSSSLYKFWQFKNHHREGRRWMQQVNQQARQELPAGMDVQEWKGLRARLLLGAGWLANDQADREEMARLFEESHRLFLDVQDRRGLGLVLQGLGEVRVVRGQYSEAVTHFLESQEIMQELGDLEEYAWVTDHLGRCYKILGELDRAEGCFTLCRKLFSQIGQQWGEDIATIHLVDVLIAQAKFHEVIQLIGPFLASKRSLQDTQGFIYTLGVAWYGEALLHTGQPTLAEQALLEASKICLQAGYHFARIPAALALLYLQENRTLEAMLPLQQARKMAGQAPDPVRSLEFLSVVVKLLLKRENFIQAAVVYGAMAHLRGTHQIRVTPIDVWLQANDLEVIQARLSEAAWQQAQDRGKKLLLPALMMELSMLLL